MEIENSTDSNLLISAKNVSYQYHNTKQFSLHQINLEIEQGKFILCCGPTGSGKTTFIRTINGLIPHFYHGTFYGYMRINNQDTVESSPTELSRTVGMVFQNPENQLFAMNVERELVFGLENLAFPREIITSRIQKAIELTGIQSLLQRSPYELSGGEQQKVAIASLLALEPDTLVFDEPLSNLDPQTALNIIQLLKKLQIDEHKTIIIVEHRLDFLLPFVDDMFFFEDGQIIFHGTPAEILNQPEIFEKHIDFPSILTWFHTLKERNQYSGNIPYTFEDQIQAFDDILFQYSPPNMIQEDWNQFVNTGEVYPTVIFQDVSFEYQSKFSSTPALSHVTTAIFPKEIVGIVGPNGAGKSTFIKCINNLRIPQHGKLYLFGEDTHLKPVYELAKKVGIIFQNPDHQLFANTVEEELKFSLKNLRLTVKEQQNRVETILQRLEIASLRDKSPFLISGGQRKKVALAAILIREPQILIFDEPTIGQDMYEKAQLKTLIHEEQAKGTIVLIVTHDIEFISSISTRILVLGKGKIIADGLPSEIFTDEALAIQNSLVLPDLYRILALLQSKYSWLPKGIVTINQLEEVLLQCQ